MLSLQWHMKQLPFWNILFIKVSTALGALPCTGRRQWGKLLVLAIGSEAVRTASFHWNPGGQDFLWPSWPLKESSLPRTAQAHDFSTHLGSDNKFLQLHLLKGSKLNNRIMENGPVCQLYIWSTIQKSNAFFNPTKTILKSVKRNSNLNILLAQGRLT